MIKIRPKILDLCCHAGGAAMGLFYAGFDVTGVDQNQQKDYPFKFMLADALEVDLSGYDAFWASPPCQFGSESTPKRTRHRHLNLIPDIRRRLIATGKPFIIENVEAVRSHLINPILICGSMLGLKVWRHRYFEASFPLVSPENTCDHSFQPVVVTGSPRRKRPDGTLDRREPTTQERRDAMEIQWMGRTQLDQAIPPAYSLFLGRQIMATLKPPFESKAAVDTIPPQAKAQRFPCEVG